MKWTENCEEHRKPTPAQLDAKILVTGDLVERIARVCVAKARQLPSSEDWLETVIGTAVADTCLILTGTFRIESLEADLGP